LIRNLWYINRYRDIGTLDEDGYVKIVGRIKDMVIRGGENVYPREIEEVLHAHPGVQEAHVRITHLFLCSRLYIFFILFPYIID